VTRSRNALAAGLAAVALYLVGAWISGSINPVYRLPVFDGGGGALAPYRWVSPPPSLAAGNKPPARARFTVSLGPGLQGAGVYSTPDS